MTIKGYAVVTKNRQGVIDTDPKYLQGDGSWDNKRYLFPTREKAATCALDTGWRFWNGDDIIGCHGFAILRVVGKSGKWIIRSRTPYKYDTKEEAVGKVDRMCGGRGQWKVVKVPR